MIDIRKLKELVRLMVENDLSELDLRDKEEQVTVKRAGAAPVVQHVPVHAPPPPVRASSAHAEASEAEAAPPESEAGLAVIDSPMVGTFYSSPNPDAPPFVTVGASIGAGTTVCLIEAMKVFNEIKSEVAGTIERILVNSGEPVEFGQKLFLVKPA